MSSMPKVPLTSLTDDSMILRSAKAKLLIRLVATKHGAQDAVVPQLRP